MGLFTKLFHPQKADIEKKAEDKKKTSTRIIASLFPRWFRADYSLANSELIFAATSRIANALSTMTMQVYQNSKPVQDDLNDLVSFEPNPNMTACQYFRTLETCRCTYGNGYALKVFTTDRTLPYLYPLDPDRVKPIIEKESRELWYRIMPDDGAPYYVHNYFMIHVPFISASGHEGISPIAVLQNTLKYQGSMEEFSLNQLSKGISAQVVLEAPANLGDTQKAKIIADFQDTYKQTGGNVLLLESGVTAKQINLSPIDAKLFESEKMSRSRVAMVYNIPPHMMGDFTDASYTSQEQQTLEFLTFTMTSIVTLYEQVHSRSLISREDRKRGMCMKMNINNYLRADKATMADVHVKGIRGGWIRPNEARRDDGLEEDPNGNELLVARDLTTLSFVVAHPEGAKANSSNMKKQEEAKNDPETGNTT